VRRLLSGETIALAVPPERVWPLFDDAVALARVVPGCESLTKTAPGRYRGVLHATVGFVSLRSDVEAAVTDRRPPSEVTLRLEGRPRGLAGSFRAVLPVRLEAATEGCVATYDLDLEVSGRLATFGALLLRQVMRRQVDQLAANIRQELGSASPPSGP
jgi:2-furoyl-CoA dehydrogenase large subunit